MTTPVRPAEPTCTGYRLPAHPGAPEERVHCNGCAEAASLRELLSAVEGERDAARDRVVDLESDLGSADALAILGTYRLAASETESAGRLERLHAAEARVSELRGLLERWAAVDEETGLCFCYEPADRCDADGACPGRESRAWLAARPLKTEGDGGTPTTETKGQP